MFKWMVMGFVLVVAVALGLLVFQTSRKANQKPELSKLVVGTDATYPPMESLDPAGKMVGFDIDLATELAKQLGVAVEFRNISWDELFKSLERGDVDMAISSISITSERSKTWLFSKPYFASGQAILVAKNNQDINGPADLKGKRVTAQKDTTGETEALKYVSDKLIERFISSYDTVVAKLENGKLDAMIIDYPAAINISESHPALKVIKPFTSEFYGIAFRKDSSALVVLIDKALANLKTTGKHKEIELKWFR